MIIENEIHTYKQNVNKLEQELSIQLNKSKKELGNILLEFLANEIIKLKTTEENLGKLLNKQ